MSDQNDTLLTMPLRIDRDLLTAVGKFSDPLLTVYLGLCQQAYGDFAPPNEEAARRAEKDLEALNRALSALGANTSESDLRKLMNTMFKPGTEWGTFRCVEIAFLEGYPDGPTSPAVISELIPETILWPSWSWGLFGLACMQRLVESEDARFLELAAEAVTWACLLGITNVAQQSRADMATEVLRIQKLQADQHREKGRKPQIERAAKVEKFARGLALGRRAEFRSKAAAVDAIQDEVRAYARKLNHPLGLRPQTIGDMLTGIQFGKKKNTH